MPMFVTCHLAGNVISVDEALDALAWARNRGEGRPDFRCVHCGAAVRPHRASASQGAHFEHHQRNRACPLSHALPTANVQ